MDGSRKRSRVPNFGDDEKAALLNIILKKKDVIENKKTDAVTWREKDRTVSSIKSFYENYKRKVKKTSALEKREIFQTGGGPPFKATDLLLDLTMNILNKKTIFGLDNRFGGDGEADTAKNENTNNDEIVIEMEEGEQIPFHYNEEVNH
ncbi:hypothetical protein RN001_003740 [Aquatica leii]|uniref:Regulatory protein zeste n=1 Tax=Aquatica leii TaxID=1421715 RepID=A0AAN7PIS6_9COLE|nr:hypothetical protein RN001_003740 [Aquatica leii]